METRDKVTFLSFRLSRLLLLFLWVHVISFFFISSPAGLLHNALGTLWIVLGFVAVQKNCTGLLLFWGIVQMIGLVLAAMGAATAAVVALIMMSQTTDDGTTDQPMVMVPNNGAAVSVAPSSVETASYVSTWVVALVLFLSILYYMLNLWAAVLTFRLRRGILTLRAEEQQHDEEMHALVAQEQSLQCHHQMMVQNQHPAAMSIMVAQPPTPAATAPMKGVTPAPVSFAPGQQIVYLPPEYAQYLAMGGGGAGAQPMFVVAPMMYPPTAAQPTRQ